MIVAMDLARSFLSWFVKAARLPYRMITRDDGLPYLERWYLCGEPGGLRYFAEGQRRPRWWQGVFEWLPCIYVHRFVASDDDVELHNHPWSATSLIVAGGYVERRARTGAGATVTMFRPGSVNRIFPDTFHKVLLIERDCWTIIACSPKVGTWGFWNENTGEFHHWREHVEKRARFGS